MRIVLGQVLAQASDLGVGLGAAQRIVRAVFANGRFHQRRPGKKDAGAATHQHHVVRQARQVGAAGRAGAVHHRDLRHPGCRHAGLVGKAAAPFDKNLGLVHQVGPTAFHQVDDWQLVLQRNLLGAQGFFQAHGRHRAAFDRTVIGRYQAAPTGHHANANNRSATHYRGFAVVVVHLQARQAAQLQKGRAAVQQTGHALARQQLIALFKLVALGLRLRNHQRLQPLHLGQQFAHVPCVGSKGLAAGIDLGQ